MQRIIKLTIAPLSGLIQVNMDKDKIAAEFKHNPTLSAVAFKIDGKVNVFSRHEMSGKLDLNMQLDESLEYKKFHAPREVTKNEAQND